MRNKNQELVRVQSVIENDRLSVGNGFEELFKNDLVKLIGDYFDIYKVPELEIQKNKDGIKVSINFLANRIKLFNYLVDG